MISLKDLIDVLMGSKTNSKKNPISTFIQITFILLDYILPFSFKPNKNELSPKNKKSNILITDDIQLSVSQKNNEEFDLTEVLINKDNLSNKDEQNENEIIEIDKMKIDVQVKKMIDIKQIYAHVLIIFLGNYYLSLQYDIKVNYFITIFNTLLKL